MKHAIVTTQAPHPSGTYSQAIKVGNTIYLAGQIAKSSRDDQMINHDFSAQVKQVFDNINEVAKAAGGDINAIVKMTIYLTDLKNFPIINEIMASYFQAPFPARTTIEVSALPAGARVEMEAIMVLDQK